METVHKDEHNDLPNFGALLVEITPLLLHLSTWYLYLNTRATMLLELYDELRKELSGLLPLRIWKGGNESTVSSRSVVVVQ